MEPPPPTPFRFSKEELRVLEECNKESFYRRCLPLGTVLGIGTYMAVKSGFLQPNAKFGPTPKVIGAVLLGYIAGKISYQSKCAEKLMSLPNSKIGDVLRKRKAGSSTLTMDDTPELDRNIPETEKYSDHPTNTGMDLDSDRPLLSNLDDAYRPNLDGLFIEDDRGPLAPPPTSKSTTYDELRRRNREEFEQKRTKAYRGVVTPEEIPTGLRIASEEPTSADSQPSNMYGDIWEK